jgi:hypothetical protein
MDGAGPAEPLRPERQLTGKDDHVERRTHLAGDAVDEVAGVASGMVGVVDHDGAHLVGERRHQGVDRSDDIFSERRHRGSRLEEAGAHDGSVKPPGEQLRADRGALEEHFDSNGAPSVDELGSEHGFPVAGGGLDDDEVLAGASGRQSWTRDVMRWDSTH